MSRGVLCALAGFVLAVFSCPGPVVAGESGVASPSPVDAAPHIDAALAAPRIDAALAPYIVGAKRSGYVYALPETRAMQDDEIMNPGFAWVERGRGLWTEVEGANGKSCASCHGPVESMAGKAVSYPKWKASMNRPVTVERQINFCRVAAMKAEPWEHESPQLLAMTTLIKQQSRGLPMSMADDGPMREWIDRGKALYFARRGQLDMSCKHCHDDHPGEKLRAETLSQAHVNGFPTYRLGWQGLGSLHRRLETCYEQMRAETYPLGSDEYVALEIFLTDRGRGLPIETPSVRR
ncbi:MAG: sulfur oxidation c-type cytochrome SoxA [Alphaproteobacteria bacterium]|nr:sulfur oxidation c-type cytochrome SoxA [Alphaproteobacteria bacterium]MBF0129032.1 sulfur oxidation c-type cytochrome SoxA [Alphaproteobacteria bacterium]